jgi:hypothetical protein
MASFGRAFADEFGKVFVLHKDAANTQIMLLDVQTWADVGLYTATDPIWQVDVERHAPTMIVWTERGASVETLKAGTLAR